MACVGEGRRAGAVVGRWRGHVGVRRRGEVNLGKSEERSRHATPWRDLPARAGRRSGPVWCTRRAPAGWPGTGACMRPRPRAESGGRCAESPLVGSAWGGARTPTAPATTRPVQMNHAHFTHIRTRTPYLGACTKCSSRSYCRWSDRRSQDCHAVSASLVGRQ